MFKAWNIFHQVEMHIRFSTDFCLILGTDNLEFSMVQVPSLFIMVHPELEIEKLSTLSKL